MTSKILTYTGKLVNPLDLSEDDIDLRDIAHALSMQCRFGGHCPRFYSVAEHSIYVSELVPAEYKLAALLHDASEAYFIDIPKPLKDNLLYFQSAVDSKSISLVEDGILSAVYRKFGLTAENPSPLKNVDYLVLCAELWQFWRYEEPVPQETYRDVALKYTFGELSPKQAEAKFLHYFESYIRPQVNR